MSLPDYIIEIKELKEIAERVERIFHEESVFEISVSTRTERETKIKIQFYKELDEDALGYILWGKEEYRINYLKKIVKSLKLTGQVPQIKRRTCPIKIAQTA